MSQVQSPPRKNTTTKSQWLDSRVLDAARITFICSIFAAVWGIGGHYPTSRFLTLALLGVSSALLCLTTAKPSLNQKNTVLFFSILLATLLYGLLQLVPASVATFLEWTGVRAVQLKFGADPSDNALTQSLVTWMTQSWLAMAVIGFAAFFLAAQMFADDRSRIFLLVAIAICGIGQVMWGVVQLTSYPDMIFYGVPNPAPGSVAFGTFLNRNHAADFIGVSLACALGVVRARSLSSASKWRTGYGVSNQFQAAMTNPLTLAIWLGVAWLLLGLVLSMSRGGWASALVAAVVVTFCWKQSGGTRRYTAMFASMAFITITFFGLQLFGFGDQVGERMNDLEVENVLSDSRFDHWAESLPAAKHFLPFGSGMGTYGYAYLPFEPEPESRWFTHAHNQYLETLVEAGLPGITLLALGLIIAIRSSLVLCSDKRSASKQALGLAALGAIVMHAFHALTDFGLMMPGNLIVLAALIGSACAAGEKRTRRKRVSRQPSVQRVASVNSEMVTDGEKPIATWERFLNPTTMSLLVLASLCIALWQQGRHVSAMRSISRTSFTDTTPSPTVQVSQERLESLEAELARWPAFEPVQRRIIRLQMHQARREVYDQIRGSSDSTVNAVDPPVAWNSTSLESVITRLFDDSPNAVDERTKAEIRSVFLANPQLNEAWEALQHSISLNPVQPRTHLKSALIACATGRPWRTPFQRSMQLAVFNSNHSLGNGLLAWAANDKQSMIAQWQRSMATGSDSIELIYKLSTLRLTEEEVVNELMPDRWVVPFRLAKDLKDDETKAELRARLLEKSSQIAAATLLDDMTRYRTQGMIAAARDDYQTASEHYAKAIKSDPKDPQLRHLAATSLYQLGEAKQAVAQARVATLLAPKNAQFREFYRKATQLHRKQYSNLTKTSNDPSRPSSK